MMVLFPRPGSPANRTTLSSSFFKTISRAFDIHSVMVRGVPKRKPYKLERSGVPSRFRLVRCFATCAYLRWILDENSSVLVLNNDPPTSVSDRIQLLDIRNNSRGVLAILSSDDHRGTACEFLYRASFLLLLPRVIPSSLISLRFFCELLQILDHLSNRRRIHSVSKMKGVNKIRSKITKGKHAGVS